MYSTTPQTNVCVCFFSYPETDINVGGPYVTHMPPTESFGMQRVYTYIKSYFFKTGLKPKAIVKPKAKK